MKEKKSIAGNILLVTWSLLCISIFIYFPGRISYIYWSNLKDIPLVIEKLSRLTSTHYFINVLVAIIGMAIFSLAYISLGSFLAKKIGVDNWFNSTSTNSDLVPLATKFLLGQGLYSIIFLTIGGLYKLQPYIVIILLAIGILSGWHTTRRSFQTLFKQHSSNDHKDHVFLKSSITILVLAIFLSSARISYDSSAIYFSDAKLTALTRHIAFFKNDVFSASVFQSAIQFSAIIQVFGDQSARMLSWVNGIVIIIFSLALGEKVGLSKSARFILLALLVTSTAFIDLMGDGKVDLISSASALAAIYWMVANSQNKNSGNSLFILIGFFAGLAIIGRPFNAFLLGIFCVLFYFSKTFWVTGPNLLSVKKFSFSLFWIGVGVGGLSLYHLFANWMILGSPLAFLSSLSNISPASGPWDFDPKQMLNLRLFYPLAVTFRNTPQSLGNISPLAIAFLPALFIGSVRKTVSISKELLALTVISITTIFFWIFSFFTIVEIRYVFFLWIILFLPIAEIIDIVLKSEDLIFRNIIFGLITILLGFIALRTVFIAIDSYSPLDRQGNPQCSDFILCDYLNSINKSASPGDRILALSAYRYYLRTDLFSCSTTHQEYQILQELSNKNSESFWLEVFRLGYKYIAYENEYTKRHLYMDFIPSPDNAPQWIHLEPIYGKPGDPVVAYKININNPPIAMERECRQNEDNIWEVKKLPAQ